MQGKILTMLVVVLLLVVCAVPVFASTHEVGTLNTGTDNLGQNVSVWKRLGQRLLIPGRYVSEVGYCVWRVGNPTGDIILAINDFTTDEVIVRKVWGDASELGIWPEDSGKFTKVVLDEPVCINGTVRLFVEYNGGNATDYCIAGYYSGNKFPGESYVNYFHYGQWHDIGEAEEGAYFYAWVDPEDLVKEKDGEGGLGPVPLWVVIPLACAIGGVMLYLRKRRGLVQV